MVIEYNIRWKECDIQVCTYSICFHKDDLGTWYTNWLSSIYSYQRQKTTDLYLDKSPSLHSIKHGVYNCHDTKSCMNTILKYLHLTFLYWSFDTGISSFTLLKKQTIVVFSLSLFSCCAASFQRAHMHSSWYRTFPSLTSNSGRAFPDFV